MPHYFQIVIIYIEQQFSRINKSIPKTPMTDALMIQYNPKIRVFYIQGHAAACTIEDYKKKNRVDFQKVFTNIQDRQQKEYIRTHASKIHKYNAVLLISSISIIYYTE